LFKAASEIKVQNNFDDQLNATKWINLKRWRLDCFEAWIKDKSRNYEERIKKNICDKKKNKVKIISLMEHLGPRSVIIDHC